MPNQPRTKGRMFRIPDEMYEAAQARADEEGETLTQAVVIPAFTRYVKSRRRIGSRSEMGESRPTMTHHEHVHKEDQP